jgi:hypothetical protein
MYDPAFQREKTIVVYRLRQPLGARRQTLKTWAMPTSATSASGLGGGGGAVEK